MAGLALFARAPVDGTYFADVLPSMLLLGIGAGLAFPALMTLAMSGATPEDAGPGLGPRQHEPQVGGALGLSVLATLSATRTDSLLAAGDSTAAALTGGYHLAFAIAAGLVVVGLVIAVTVLRAVAPARETAGSSRGRPGDRDVRGGVTRGLRGGGRARRPGPGRQYVLRMRAPRELEAPWASAVGGADHPAAPAAGTTGPSPTRRRSSRDPGR